METQSKTVHVFKAKNEEGLYFAGGYASSKRWNEFGHPYRTLAALENDLVKLFNSRTTESKINNLAMKITIVEQTMVISETPSGDISQIALNLVEKQRVLKTIKAIDPRKPPYAMYVDLDNLFPKWELNGFHHLAYMESFSYASAADPKPLNEIIRGMKLSRSTYKKAKRTVAFRSKKEVLAVKLAAPAGETVHYYYVGPEVLND